MGGKCASAFSGVRAVGRITGEDDFLSNCPRIGASDSTGEPGQGVPALLPVALLTTLTRRVGSLPAGWLYNHVATSTVDEPMTNDRVMLKLKRITDARKDRMMERLVAKPLRILSEYLITIAVMSPPKT